MDITRKIYFWSTQVVAITIIILTLVHIFQYRDGFGGRSYPKQEFSWHVFFMTLGFTYFTANGLVAFRLLPLMGKTKLKLIHMGLNVGVVLCAGLGLVFVIDERNIQGKSHFISLHSWIGIMAIALLVIQGICGSYAYLMPGVPPTFKEFLLPWHIKAGFVIFLLGVAAIITGFKKGNTDAERLIINFTGVFVIILCFIVFSVLTNSTYKYSYRLR